MAKNKKEQFAYKHKETGKFLEMCYVGDGEIYLNLVDKVTRDCILDNKDWSLEEIIQSGDGGVEIGNYPNSTWLDLTPEDFEEQKLEIVLK